MPATPRLSLCSEAEVPSLELADPADEEDDIVPKLQRGRSTLPRAPPPTPVSAPTVAPVRPKLKRRDTPRPVPCAVETMAIYSPRPRLQRGKPLHQQPRSPGSIYPSSAGVYAEDGPVAKRKYTSVIDGGHWVILDH